MLRNICFLGTLTFRAWATCGIKRCFSKLEDDMFNMFERHPGKVVEYMKSRPGKLAGKNK